MVFPGQREWAVRPRVVSYFESMKILIIADDEFFGGNIPDGPADVLVSLGDMPDAVILQVAAHCQCRKIFAVKGNHDSASSFPEPVYDLHLRIREFEGVTFGGFAGAWKYKPRGHFLFEQEEVEAHLAGFPAVDIFLAHNSPRLIHDRDDEVHLGFVGFNHYIRRASPKFFLHGHQHHAAHTMVGQTNVIGTFGHRFITVLPAPL